MTTLREKMKQEMTLVGLAQSTQNVYMKAVERLYEHYQRSPAKLSADDIRNYLLFLKERKLAPNTYNTQVYGLRFFYCITLRQPLRKLDLPTTKVTYKLPSILSPNEVKRIINAVSNIKHRALLMVIYGSGLRVSEAVKLKAKDIDRDRMTLHIRCGKGGKDRYVILSLTVLNVLEQYWQACKFTDYVFFSTDKSKSLTTSSASQIYKAAKVAAGVTKAGGIHGLRHAFATHLLESGAEIFSIKELLGHASIQSTVRYLAFVPHRHQNLASPIDRLLS